MTESTSLRLVNRKSIV